MPWKQRHIAVFAFACCPFAAFAQTPADAPTAPAAATVWLLRTAAAVYLLPDEENYVQPTLAADRDRWHLEGRFNYEDRHSLSAFVGWNFETGSKVTLELTPMIGGVAGDTRGIIPALGLTLTFGRLEAYSEAEYVIDVVRTEDRYLFNWSEVTISVTDWLRAGLAIQRTRALRESLDVQRGFLSAVSLGKLETAFYYFNPGSKDHYVVVSCGLRF